VKLLELPASPLLDQETNPLPEWQPPRLFQPGTEGSEDSFITLTDQAPARRGRGAVIATAILAALLAVALGLGGHFWLASDRWQATSHAWEDQARTHGATVGDLEASLSQSQRELATTQGQLTTATERIIELADEKAQLGDAAAATGFNLDFQRQIIAAATNVATALAQCTAGQARLIEYLQNAERYDPASLQQFANQVSGFCQQATDANARLQEVIGA
jgi:hypothetical protein